ncbi:MAG TPA: hypothetical protein VIY08_03435 [Candidatus Nitrosocosmicus sp.]
MIKYSNLRKYLNKLFHFLARFDNTTTKMKGKTTRLSTENEMLNNKGTYTAILPFFP